MELIITSVRELLVKEDTLTFLLQLLTQFMISLEIVDLPLLYHQGNVWYLLVIMTLRNAKK